MAVAHGSGKQAIMRFPCLAILRYTVATVVTVLAVVLIVMVIAVGVRPDDVSASVVQGHVSTSDLWNETTVYVDEPYYTGRGGRRGGCFGVRGAPYSELRSCFGPGGGEDDVTVGIGGVYSRRPPTRTVYSRVEALDLDVILSVDNPSGRGSIYCQRINVSFHAGTAPGTGMPIGAFYLPSSFDFHVKPQTSHKIARSLRIYNSTVLDYIASEYGGQASFTGVVEVTMNTSSVVTLGHHTHPSIVKLVCSPVDFGVGDADATATSVQCIKN